MADLPQGRLESPEPLNIASADTQQPSFEFHRVMSSGFVVSNRIACLHRLSALIRAHDQTIVVAHLCMSSWGDLKTLLFPARAAFHGTIPSSSMSVFESVAKQHGYMEVDPLVFFPRFASLLYCFIRHTEVAKYQEHLIASDYAISSQQASCYTVKCRQHHHTSRCPQLTMDSHILVPTCLMLLECWVLLEPSCC